MPLNLPHNRIPADSEAERRQDRANIDSRRRSQDPIYQQERQPTSCSPKQVGVAVNARKD